LSAPTRLDTARNCGPPHWLRLPPPALGASGCPAGCSPARCRTGRPLLGATTRRSGSRPPSFGQGYCEPSVHRRPAPTRRAVAFRSDRSLRAPLLRFFPLQRFGCAALSGFAISRTVPLQRLSLSRAVCWRVTDCALAVFRSRKRRLPVTPAPVRPGSCTVDLLCGGVPLPGRTISQPCRLLQSGNAPGVQHPSQFYSCPRVRSPFGVVRPPAVSRASHPDNLVGGPVAPIPHPLRLRLAAGARRGSWVLSPQASSPSGSRAGWDNTALGLRLSQVFGHRKHRHAGGPFSRPRRSASHGYRFRHPDAHGFCWRCRCAASGNKSDAPSGTHHMGASPADPSAFVAGA